MSLPFTPKSLADVDIVNGTVMRSGIAAKAFGQPGGGVQYQIMGRATFSNPHLIEPIIPTFW